MCASCGKDLTVATAQGTSKLSSVAIIHSQPRLTVTMKEAQRVDKETAGNLPYSIFQLRTLILIVYLIDRLLKQKKLSLVLDLDHTLIHAATETHFQQFAVIHKIDPKSEQLHQFSLPGSSVNYFVKLRYPRSHYFPSAIPSMQHSLTLTRPHLQEFLEVVSSLFELHMYTFGTRMYALKVAQIIDPGNRIFKERILSRDDCGGLLLLSPSLSSTTTFTPLAAQHTSPLLSSSHHFPLLTATITDIDHKTLKRIFPCDDSMVVIVDDREDVWKKSKNLVRIEPCMHSIAYQLVYLLTKLQISILLDSLK